MATPPEHGHDRWRHGSPSDARAGYEPGNRRYDVARHFQRSEYAASIAEKAAGGPFGSNGIGRLREVALHYPGVGGPHDLDLRLLQRETESLGAALEDNGVAVHWADLTDAPMGPARTVGPLHLAWGMIWRGGSIISEMGASPTTIGLTEHLAKWAWNELDIPVLTAITDGACESGSCLFLAQDVLVTAISCAFSEEGVDQFASTLARTSGTEQFHNLILRPPTKTYFDADTGACAHPDMSIAPLDVGKVMIAAASFDWAARQWLEDNDFEIVEVDAREQRARLAPCNCIPLEPGKVIMHAECAETIRSVRAAGVEVIEVPATESLKTGAGIRRRTMQIYREPGPTLEDVRTRRVR